MDKKQPITTAKEFIAWLKQQDEKRKRDALGYLYDPIIKKEWTLSSLDFTNGEVIPYDKLIEIVYRANKEQLDDENHLIVGSNPYKIRTLHTL
jgi:uncharacterized protein YaaR (DUF327 family)